MFQDSEGVLLVCDNMKEAIPFKTVNIEIKVATTQGYKDTANMQLCSDNGLGLSQQAINQVKRADFNL